jgi:hypothetical protein
MSQGSYVPNLKPLGAPKNKWQAITHNTQHTDNNNTQTTTTHNGRR